ncbi:MAG: beta-lactamase family protein [Gammaproteobacteria bacterium]|nr:beta-lactamase family protein [Gammaproteobacteria bacterium]
MRTLAERNTQLCVYHNGKRVVDLWASAIGDTDFSADTLVNVFSSGKSLEAIALASLVDKGLLDYNARIIDYWPAFGGSGKEALTVAELMRHEAGLANFSTSLDPQDLLTENIKLNKIGRVIESESQNYSNAGPGKREYHAMTRGWIVNEIFRRVDPAGRTIGEFLREDISEPMQTDVIIGVRETELGRIADVVPLGFGFQLLESLKPKFLRKMENNLFQILAKIILLLPMLGNSNSRNNQGTSAPLKGMGQIRLFSRARFRKDEIPSDHKTELSGLNFFNHPTFRMGETPSANANCTARGLAKLAAMMSAGGVWEGDQYLSETAWKALHDHPVVAAMGTNKFTFTQGGVAHFSEPPQPSTRMERALNTGREGFYGWMGLGGSIFQWHPEYCIGFGYVPTSLNVLDLVNERGKTYQAEVLKCIDHL